MSAKNQEGNEAQEFIDKFKRISTDNVLRQFEVKNRDQILNSGFEVMAAFNDQWLKVTGKSYFQPVTTAPVQLSHGQNNTERSDPKGRNYRAIETFSEIEWERIRRKMSKRFVYLYNLYGTVKETGRKRPIFQNLSPDRVKDVLGKDATKILDTDKKETHGIIKGTFELEVEGYWEVIFMPKKDQNDTKDVRLLWEGQCLVIQRQEKVIVPGFYLEVADNALRDHFVQEPGQGRKKVGTILEYPYTPLREATLDEHLAQREAGNRIMRDKRVKEEG